MLKLLLDEHISPAVAKGVRRRHPSLTVLMLAEWEDGNFLGQDDSACLRAAAAQKLTLVTYDRRTIPPLLKTRTEEGRSYGGVIFVDEETIAPSEIGGLVRALSELYRETGKLVWTDRALFLRR